MFDRTAPHLSQVQTDLHTMNAASTYVLNQMHVHTNPQTETGAMRPLPTVPLLLDHLISPVLGQGAWKDLPLRERVQKRPGL